MTPQPRRVSILKSFRNSITGGGSDSDNEVVVSVLMRSTKDDDTKSENETKTSFRTFMFQLRLEEHDSHQSLISHKKKKIIRTLEYKLDYDARTQVRSRIFLVVRLG